MGQLLFKKIFWNAIRDGTKRTTIRRWSTPRLKPGQRAWTPGVGWLAIESVEQIDRLDHLSDADALADGFPSASAMLAALRSLYPNSARDRRSWFRIAFRREDSDAADAMTATATATRAPKRKPRTSRNAAADSPATSKSSRPRTTRTGAADSPAISKSSRPRTTRSAAADSPAISESSRRPSSPSSSSSPASTKSRARLAQLLRAELITRATAPAARRERPETRN